LIGKGIKGIYYGVRVIASEAWQSIMWSDCFVPRNDDQFLFLGDNLIIAQKWF